MNLKLHFVALFLFQISCSFPKNQKSATLQRVMTVSQEALHACALSIAQSNVGFALDAGGTKISNFMSPFADDSSMFLYGLAKNDTSIYFFDRSGFYKLFLSDQRSGVFFPSKGSNNKAIEGKFDLVLPVKFNIRERQASLLVRLKSEINWIEKLKFNFVKSYDSAGRYKRNMGVNRDLWPQDVWNNVTDIDGISIEYGLIRAEKTKDPAGDLIQMLNAGFEQEYRELSFRHSNGLKNFWKPIYNNILPKCQEIVPEKVQKFLDFNQKFAEDLKEEKTDPKLTQFCGTGQLAEVYLRCAKMEIAPAVSDAKKCLNISKIQSGEERKASIRLILKIVHPDLNASHEECAKKTTQWVNSAREILE